MTITRRSLFAALAAPFTEKPKPKVDPMENLTVERLMRPDGIDGKVVAMVPYRGELMIATEYGLFRTR